jgi:hypothetical protein
MTPPIATMAMNPIVTATNITTPSTHTAQHLSIQSPPTKDPHNQPQRHPTPT